MKRAHILVEGQTEETFVRQVLAPHLLAFELHLNPVLATTKRTKSGSKFRGGVSRYGKLKGDLRRLLGDTGVVVVTTMLDYYGLPDDSPGVDTLPATTSGNRRVAHLEEAMKKDLVHPRFLPYLSLHEFEALLLAAPQQIGEVLRRKDAFRELESAIEQVASPEEIDDGPTTHPAERIARCAPGYRKALHGPQIAQLIGLETLRRRCPHFADWVARLEEIAQVDS